MIIFAGVVVFVGIYYVDLKSLWEECTVQVRSLTLALGSLWCVSSLQASLQMPSSTTLADNCFIKILLKQGHLGPSCPGPCPDHIQRAFGYHHGWRCLCQCSVTLTAKMFPEMFRWSLLCFRLCPLVCVWRRVAVREGGGWASGPNKYPCYAKLSIC